MGAVSSIGLKLHETEERLLEELRALRRGLRRKPEEAGDAIKLTAGQRVADTVAATMGSWTFIIIQSVILLIWIILNVTAYVQQWDPYPFILLNLALSFQAAYAAPFIMMSQNRQQDIDRQAAENDYKVNIKAVGNRAPASEDRPDARAGGIGPHPGGEGAHGLAGQGQAGLRRDSGVSVRAVVRRSRALVTA